MNDQEKTKEELQEELHQLQLQHDLLKTACIEKPYDSLHLLKAGIDSPPDMIILFIDKQYRYQYFNSYHKEVMISAYGVDVQLGMNILNCITNVNDRRKAQINYNRALAGESHTTVEEYGEIERAYWETRYNPILNENNETIGATAFSTNITEKKKAENLLKESSRRFKIAIDNFPYEFVILDPQFKILYLNKLALQRFQKSFGEVVGSFLNDMENKELVNQCLSLQKEITISKKPVSKNIETGISELKQFAKITYIPLLDEEGLIREIFRISIDLTNIRKTETQLRALSNQLEKSREEERHRISRDIHDDLGQILTALKIDLGSLHKHPPTKEELPDLLEPIISLVDSAIDSARRVSFELRPGILDQTGLIPAMAWLINELKKRQKIEFEVEFPDDILVPIDIEKSVTVYRIFQEILTNISRHAYATKVTVILNIESELIKLEVSDNGGGFNLDTHAESLGLLGMKERAKIQNGTLEVKSGLEEGTTITLSIPVITT